MFSASPFETPDVFQIDDKVGSSEDILTALALPVNLLTAGKIVHRTFLNVRINNRRRMGKDTHLLLAHMNDILYSQMLLEGA